MFGCVNRHRNLRWEPPAGPPCPAASGHLARTTTEPQPNLAHSPPLVGNPARPRASPRWVSSQAVARWPVAAGCSGARVVEDACGGAAFDDPRGTARASRTFSTIPSNTAPKPTLSETSIGRPAPRTAR
jgi:hypothetical protein